MSAPAAEINLGSSGPELPWHRPVAAGAVLVAILLALTPLIPVFGSFVMVRVALIAALLAAALAWTATRLRWTPLVTAAAGLGLYLVAGLAVVAPPWEPGRSVLTGLRTLLTGPVTSWKNVLTLSPPFGAEPRALVLVWFLVFAATLVAVSLALRSHGGTTRAAAYAGIVPILLLGFALIVADHETWWPLVMGAVLAVLAVLTAGLGARSIAWRRPAALAALIAVPLAAGIAVPMVLASDRLVVRDSMEPPWDPASHESPLSIYRGFINAEETPQITLSELPAGARVRLATMDTYNGVVWSVSTSSRTGEASSGEFRRFVSEREVSTTGEDAEIDVTINKLAGVWLPTVGDTRKVETSDGAMREALRFNPATGTAVDIDGVTEGQTYTLDAVLPETAEDEALGAAAIDSVRLGPADRIPEIVGVIAREWAAGASTPLAQARALEENFQAGWYSDGAGETQGEVPSPAGHGVDRMVELLDAEAMVGNAEQYASAMALMARELGLPSRVVLGFTAPELPEGTEASGEIVLTGDNIDAWVEIAFQGYGWIAFDPTPDRSKLPMPDDVPEQPEEKPQVTQPRPTPPEPTQLPTPTTSDARPAEEPDEPEAVSIWPRVLAIGGISLGALLVLSSPFILIAGLKARRRRARRRNPDPRQRVIGAWDEVEAMLTDMRQPTQVSATRLETAESLTGAGGEATLVVASAADAAQYSPQEPTAELAEYQWRAWDSVHKGLLGGLSRWRRLRLRTSAASLRRRRGPVSPSAPLSRRES